MDPLVKIVSVSDVAGIDPTTLAPAPQRQVVYTVGPHGPFTLITPAKDYSADYVNTHTQKTVNDLRAIGAIT